MPRKPDAADFWLLLCDAVADALLTEDVLSNELTLVTPFLASGSAALVAAPSDGPVPP